jgi:hypothetical protein
LNKTTWTDAEKQQATSLKNDFCNIANNIPECSGVCGGSSPPPDKWQECKTNTTTTNCNNCKNLEAQKLCKVYILNPNPLANTPSCKANPKYLSGGWFNSLLGTNADDSVATQALNEFKTNVCSISDCKQALYSQGLSACD